VLSLQFTVCSGIEAYFKQDMAEGVKSVAIYTEEVNGTGDWAFERGNYQLDGTRGAETGALVAFLRIRLFLFVPPISTSNTRVRQK
jgi:hypothetical protein